MDTAACSISHGRILLANAIFVDREIVSADIRNEVAVRVLNERLDGHDSSGRVEMDLRLLAALFTLKQRRGQVDSARGFEQVMWGRLLAARPPANSLQPLDPGRGSPVRRRPQNMPDDFSSHTRRGRASTSPNNHAPPGNSPGRGRKSLRFATASSGATPPPAIVGSKPV